MTPQEWIDSAKQADSQLENLWFIAEGAAHLAAALAERDALRAEVERLKAAPVVVPDIPWNVIWNAWMQWGEDGSRAAQEVTDWIRSRLRTIGPGEVVVPADIFQEAVSTAEWMSKFECQCDESVGHICEACSAARFKRRLDALRPQNGGAT